MGRRPGPHVSLVINTVFQIHYEIASAVRKPRCGPPTWFACEFAAHHGIVGGAPWHRGWNNAKRKVVSGSPVRLQHRPANMCGIAALFHSATVLANHQPTAL